MDKKIISEEDRKYMQMATNLSNGNVDVNY